jgi:(p)ppGpp synthase/HD superfamily hydrolase
MHLGQQFERALTYALHVHGGHVRKGSDVPYFSHLMGVAATVIENGGNEDQAIAALLHDAVEDQGGRPRLADIKDRFGKEVARIVEACSDSLDAAAGEDKEPWLERKRRYLASLPKKDDAILRVSVADKLHNARAIYRDAKAGRGAFWQRFQKAADGGAGETTDRSIAYYTALLRILRRVHKTPVTQEFGDAVAALESLVQDRRRHAHWVRELLSGGA